MQAIIYDMGNKWLRSVADESISRFEEQYIGLRRKENRIYTDSEVAALPFISNDHPHSREWKMRQKSCQRLTKYLEQKERPLKILDLGCGNGWLSHRMAAIPGAFVTALDINDFELQQARRVFSGVSRLQFINGSIDANVLVHQQFDIIVFSASIQYFRSFASTIQQCMQLLSSGGEIHILDTHFYKIHEVEAAIQRTREYYQSMGFSELAEDYFHHSVHELNIFPHKIFYNPSSVLSFLRPNSNPFPWICIKKEDR